MKAKTKVKVEELQKISAIAVPGDNGLAIVHVPRSPSGKRCWILNQAKSKHRTGQHRQGSHYRRFVDTAAGGKAEIIDVIS